MTNPLPPPFLDWFARRGWAPRRHQLEMVEAGLAGRDVLLVAPTGGGKTLGGFLPSLIELAARGPVNAPPGVHTLYISPLKALTTDVERNLMTPVREMGLDIRIETRTGDTPVSKRQRQKERPPDILLTTPEQLALMCAWEGGRDWFNGLRCVIVDEVHAIWSGKRGDLLNLGLARLSQFSPVMRRVGLSATVQDPDAIRRWLSPGGEADLVLGDPGAPPQVEVMGRTSGTIPWSGWTAAHAMGDVYERIKAARLALVFVNTRFQAEMAFQMLWEINTDDLPIALHHGSLAVEQRRRVEAAMARGDLRAVVCTSTLDLGIDWGDVDLVIQLAAPKGSARLIQRIGRANHRLDEPSRALLVPAHRFEVLECEAAKAAVAENDLDADPAHPGALDVLAQHLMGLACAEPFQADAVFDEVRTSAPYADLSREDFVQVLEFVSSGGYALKTYDRFRRIVQDRQGRWGVRNAETAARHRMNVGAIVDIPMLNLRVGNPKRAGRKLGQMEESYLSQLTPGDTFIFGGQTWRFNEMAEMDCFVSPAPPGSDPMVPSWGGSKFALSTYLARRVRQLIADEASWGQLPDDVRDWLYIQKMRSLIPSPDEMLVESFQRGQRHYLVCYPFDGRISHGTLGHLLARRLERAGKHPVGMVANDYALAIWALRPLGGVDLASLFQEDLLGDDLEAWLDESFMMKRGFRQCAAISGLIQRRLPGHEKSGRQVTFSTDLIYDVLRRHQPDHLLLKCARMDAAAGQLDVARVGALLKRVRGRIVHTELSRPSPFAVPAMLEIGSEPVMGGSWADAVLQENAEDLIAEAMELDA
ncbi:ligase-associated DNA damage response DEXH box helicase [Brevundimonas aveniformis]|uniref:ligase-associated DNA damage response DEXH box helicase n=1 Tax=Brevundimonas aveniformis TaxID=370977 RepID=UPI002491DC25|nr:ligase-associated DNA damage response DEXH box helicase [Brevundimonas aveniformis]